MAAQSRDLLGLTTKTSFRLRLEITLVGFSIFVAQAVLLRFMALDVLFIALAFGYITAADKQLKTRREYLSPIQKRILFGSVALAWGSLPLALLLISIIRQTPVVWMVFGMCAVIYLVVVFHEHDQIYNGRARD